MNQSSVCSNAPPDEEMVSMDYEVLGKRMGTTPTVTTTVSVSMIYSELIPPDQPTQVRSIHRNTESIDLA